MADAGLCQSQFARLALGLSGHQTITHRLVNCYDRKKLAGAVHRCLGDAVPSDLDVMTVDELFVFLVVLIHNSSKYRTEALGSDEAAKPGKVRWFFEVVVPVLYSVYIVAYQRRDSQGGFPEQRQTSLTLKSLALPTVDVLAWALRASWAVTRVVEPCTGERAVYHSR